MIEHMVEISQPQGPSARVWIRLNPHGWGTWQTIDKGFFCYEGGLADTGNNPTDPIAWVAMYGADMPDDEKLVLHLDGFQSFTGVEEQGDGLVYAEDHLLMNRGKVTWKLVGA